MKILILTYQGYIAGSTFSVFYLARGLASRGHQVYVGCKEDQLLYELLEPTKVEQIPVPFRNKLDWKSIQKVRGIVENKNIELINAQASIDRYISMTVKKLYYPDIKVVHTRRQKPDSSGGKLQGKLYTWGTDKIVAVSEGVKQELISLLGIPKNHIKVIHNGSPEEKYQEVYDTSVSDLRKKYNLTAEDRVIGCVSRPKRQKQLIKALRHVDQKVKVMFVGVEKQELDISEDDIPEHHDLIFVGEIAPKEALRYYKLFDIHVLPSVTEGLSQSLLEAMFLEVPVIATDAMGNPDLISHGETGFLYKSGKPQQIAKYINRLLKNNKLSKTIAENAKKEVQENFTIENVIENYEDFFRKLLQ